MKKNNVLCPNTPWSNNENSVWLGSSIKLLRNIEKFKFPAKLALDRRKQIISLVGKELENASLFTQPRLLKAEEINPNEKEYFVEHFLDDQNFQQTYAGEAFLLDQTGEYLICLNLENHIQLQKLDCKEELENSWEKLVGLEIGLGKVVNYAFNSKFGFLTADPTHCGTGLVVSIFLQLPALILTQELDQVLHHHIDESIEATSLKGGLSEIIGDLIILRNHQTLGVTEENILAMLRSLATKIIVQEKSIRSNLAHEDEGIIKNKVSRAYAILLHSYQIETIEALNAISLIKLGIELGWVKGASNKDLNALFFNCRRAHLLCQAKEEFPIEQLSHKRAEFIHQKLKDLKLVI